MKFTQLPLGARFEYEGRVYVKSSPIAASSETGARRMIPRYALLTPLDAVAKPAPRPARALDAAEVATAFEAFAADCARLLEQAATDPGQHGRLSAEMAAARQRFREILDIR